MKSIALVVFVMLVTSVSFAQYATFDQVNRNAIAGGFGVTWINDQPFYTVRFMPEFAFSDIGVGLDLRLEFDANGNLRKENFNEFSDYASIIRYIRYGNERQGFYLKLGALDYTTIGHGSIINAYNNSPSIDARRVGVQWNLNYDNAGLQSMYGNFGEAGVAGIRGYVKPLKFIDAGDIPVIGNFEIGATYAGDFNKFASIDAVNSLNPLSVSTNGSLNIIGFDLGFPIIQGESASLVLYFDCAKILNFGSGTAAGVMFSTTAIPLVDLRAKVERRFNGEHYLPAYFNSLYELERFNTVTGASKSLVLKNGIPDNNGVYGDLLIRIINTFEIFGSYQKLDNYSQSGILHLWTALEPKEFPFLARAGYDKTNIIDWKDLITTDDRSYVYAELGYKPVPYLIISTVYSWTYTPVRNGDDIVGYEPQKRIEPKISFVIPLD